MALDSLDELDRFAASGSFPPAWADLEWGRVFFVPADNVEGALVATLRSATHSLFVAMYDLTLDSLVSVLLSKLADSDVYVQLTLDESEAETAREAGIVRQLPYPSSSVAIGKSEKGNIIHHKVAVVDSTDVVTGSTNWSYDGTETEDNDLVVIRDPTFAAYYQARLAALHTFVLSEPQPPIGGAP